jgi:hypothetical protein
MSLSTLLNKTFQEDCFFENRNFIVFDNGTCEKTKVPFAEIANKRYVDLKQEYSLLKIGA